MVERIVKIDQKQTQDIEKMSGPFFGYTDTTAVDEDGCDDRLCQ